MAIEKRISLTIDTSSATAQIKKLQDAISGLNDTIPTSTNGDNFPSPTPAKRKALIDYTGSLSNANRLVIQSSNYATLAEKATLAQDTALRKLNQAYDQGRIDVASYNAAVADVNSRFSETTSTLNRTTTATGQATSGFKVMRGGLTQLSYQLQDVAVQAQMGTSWFTIIGQQGPQIASILGPFGALLGIVIAVGAALGGVLFKSLDLVGDKVEDVTDSFDAVNKVFETTKKNTVSLTSDFRDLSKESESLSKIRFATALFESSKLIEQSGDLIENTFDDVTTSLLGISGVSFQEVTSRMNRLASVGVSLESALIGGNQVLKDLEAIRPDGFDAFSIEAIKFRSTVDGAIDTASDFSDNIETLSATFGISEKSTISFVKSISDLQGAKTSEEVDTISKSMADFAIEVATSTDATASQKSEVISLANSYIEFAQKLSAAYKVAKTGSEQLSQVGRDREAFALPFTNAAVATADLNSEFNNTSALLLTIQAEYERLNELQQENSSVDIETARNQARQNSISLIADEISGLDSIADREAFINEISERGLDLSGQEIDALMDRAQATKHLYEEQLAYNNSLSDNLSILGEIAGQGAKDYADSVKSINEELQNLVTSTFSSMEDALVSWAETGKASFSDFVNSALSDLLRLIVRQQLAGIATGITGAFSTGTGDVSVGSVATTTSAKGNVITPSTYAKGGVTGMANTVQSTPKYFANGGGLLGEAGSEAIIPLTRTSGGDLGVKMTGSGGSSTVINYNVTNEAGIESTQSQSTNEDGSIDINVINKLVSKSIASGYADKAITGRFETRKRGK